MECKYCSIETKNRHFCSRACGANYNRIQQLSTQSYNKKLLEEQYLLNPKSCKYCDNPLSFEDAKTKIFCNSSCSAKYNNDKRPKVVIKQVNH